jgi:hypothetical protein
MAMAMNVVVLSLCLAGILLFKNLVGDRAASLIDQVAGSGSGAGTGSESRSPGDGASEGTAAAAPAPPPGHATARTVSTARALLHRALPATDDAPQTP